MAEIDINNTTVNNTINTISDSITKLVDKFEAVSDPIRQMIDRESDVIKSAVTEYESYEIPAMECIQEFGEIATKMAEVAGIIHQLDTNIDGTPATAVGDGVSNNT